MSGWKIICLHPLDDVTAASFITKEAAVVFIREHDIYPYTKYLTIIPTNRRSYAALPVGDHVPDNLRGISPIERCLLEPVEVE